MAILLTFLGVAALPAAETLQVADSGEDAVFGVGEPPLNGSPKKRHLIAQRLGTLLRQDLHEMFEHRLDAASPGGWWRRRAGSRHGEGDEVFPARRAVQESYLSGGIAPTPVSSCLWPSRCRR